MTTDIGRDPLGQALAVPVEPQERLAPTGFDPSRSVSPYSFCWREPGKLEERALELARSMAAVKCKNKYPVGVIGAEARAHYTEARRIAELLAERTGA